ncbi:TRAP transporter substrate-binding protein [Sneathiella chinensis]|uniref:Sialic acid-binding periplasmic protein SiaP n=1 Tax=Sneathiella chinensis TaxID=349750 RepID=A0ABQ5U0A3_9PROT|nr:TRAP transporter substrate-binding protein [Sneathiella chinensis]GLQ05158.1 sialic acid-binding periplasmic protein SiaP [Sneathiella chinensis]
MNQMKLSKIVAAFTVLLGATTAHAEDVKWRFASVTPIESPEGQVFQKFAEQVEKYSGGSLKITIYPNEQLGKVDAVLEQLQRGTVHMFAEGSSFMRKWSPDISFVGSSFLFDDREHWVRFMNSGMVANWYREIEKQQGISVLGDPTEVVRGPYRVMVSNKPLNNFDDVQGVKLRMHPSKLALAMWSHMGADVRTLAWTDVYQSISKGIVEAVNSPIALVETMRFYEVAPYLMRHDEFYQSIAFMVNKKALDALTDEQREALLKAHKDAGKVSHEIMNAVAAESVERMQSKHDVKMVSVDRAPFVEAMKSFYAERDKAGELPEGFLAEVEATRNQ